MAEKLPSRISGLVELSLLGYPVGQSATEAHLDSRRRTSTPSKAKTSAPKWPFNGGLCSDLGGLLAGWRQRLAPPVKRQGVDHHGKAQEVDQLSLGADRVSTPEPHGVVQRSVDRFRV